MTMELVATVGADGRPMTPNLTDRWVREMAERNHLPKETWNNVVVYSATGEVVSEYFFPGEEPADRPMHVETIINICCAQDGQEWPCATRIALDARADEELAGGYE